MKNIHVLKVFLIISIGLSGWANADDGKKYTWRLAETWGATLASSINTMRVHLGARPSSQSWGEPSICMSSPQQERRGRD
jgi:hypothetical protein